MTSCSHQIKVQTDPGRSAAAPSSRASGICHRPVTAAIEMFFGSTIWIDDHHCMYQCMKLYVFMYVCMHACMHEPMYIYIYETICMYETV